MAEFIIIDNAAVTNDADNFAEASGVWVCTGSKKCQQTKLRTVYDEYVKR